MANSEQVILLFGSNGTESWNNWRAKQKKDHRIDFNRVNIENLKINFFVLILVLFKNLVPVNFTLTPFIIFSALSEDDEKLYRTLFWSFTLIFLNLRYIYRLLHQLRNKNGYPRNLTNANLASANFTKANLVNTNFENAQLQKANFKNANLSNAILKVATALGTSFQEATLTGACIEDWNINSSTNFEGVICDYVYLKWDNEKNQPTERRPSDPHRNFAPDEFTRLFQVARETIDLIFNDGVDWRAFLTSYQDIQCESDYGELEIRAIEKSLDGSFIIRVEVPEETNKAELESQFYERYEVKLKQLEGFYQQQLRAKDTEIKSYRRESANMNEIARLLASRPITVEAKAVAEGNVQQSGNFGIGVNEGKVQKDAIAAGIYNESPKRDLQVIAQEIKTLLENLSGQHNDNKDILTLKLSELQKNLIEISAKLES